MKILVMRMLGLGDVAAIGVPAVRLLRARHPDAEITFLTFGAGAELAALVPEIDHVVSVDKEQWPDSIVPAMQSFSIIGQDLGRGGFDRIYNLDTWFLPCFLAQLLHDVGFEVHGNSLRWSVQETLARLGAGELTQHDVSYPKQFLASTFPQMEDWTRSWWLDDPSAGPYPRHYLNHCCGLEGELDHRIDVPASDALREEADGKPIVAVAMRARTKSRQYPHEAALTRELEAGGFHLWGGFDGSIPMHETLGRLKASDLLVTVSSAPQWLAKAVDCPSLVVPGHVPPAVLRADVTMEQVVDCQFCMQATCVEDRDYACMDVPAERIANRAAEFLRARVAR